MAPPMKSHCIRCGVKEFRINGYCSIYCEDMHELELEIKTLGHVISAFRNEITSLREAGR